MIAGRVVRSMAATLLGALLLGSCVSRPPVIESADELTPLHAIARQVLALQPEEPELVAVLDVALLRRNDSALAQRLFAFGGLDPRGAQRIVARTDRAALTTAVGSAGRTTILLRGRFGVLPTAIAMRSLRRIGSGRWQGPGVYVERRGTTELLIHTAADHTVNLSAAPHLGASVSFPWDGALRTPLIGDYADHDLPLAFVAAAPSALRAGSLGDAIRGTAVQWVALVLHAQDVGGATTLEGTISFAGEGAARAGLVLTRLASAMLLRAYADVELDRARVTMNREGQRVKVAGVVLTYAELARIVDGL